MSVERVVGDESRRTVVLAADPLAVARELLPGRSLLAPNVRAARAVRGRGAVWFSLHGRAARTLARRGVAEAGPVSRLLALRGAVAEVLGPADVEGTARRVEPVISELLRAGLASRPWLVETLEAAAGVGRRSVQVARLVLAYSRRLQERGQVDAAELLWRAAPVPPDPEVVLVSGYARLGEGEVAFVDALAAPGSAVVLPRGFASSDAAAAQLGARGWKVVEDERLGDAPGPRLAARFTAAVGEAPAQAPGPIASQPLTAHRLPNEEDEVRFVLSRVKALLEGGARADAIAIVARDERGYGPLVKAVAAEFGVPVRLAYAVPLRETRFGEAVALLVEAVGRVLPFEPTAKLLRHPLTRALSEEAWATARASHPAGAEEWLASGVQEAALLDWPDHASWDAYRQRLAAAFEGLELAAHASQRDRRARSKLEGALREALPPTGSAAASEVVALGRFLSLLGDVLDTAVMPAEPPMRGAVELHTPLAVFGARYDHVFAIGLAEGGFPRSVGDDPVVDFRERRALGTAGLALEDASGAAEREELSFLAVLHACGESLTLTCPESFGGKERLPSSFFAAVGAAPLPPEPRAPGSSLERLVATLLKDGGQAREAWQVERRREGGDPPDAYDGVHGVPLPLAGPYSATQLVAFGQCSFRWFLQYGLRLEVPDEAEEEVSPATVGSVFHKALALAVDRARRQAPVCGDAPGSDPFRRAVLDHLEGAYDEADAEAQRGERRVRSLTWPLRRRDNLETLRRLVMSPDFALPGSRVLAVERWFEATWRGLRVRGAVDRIDAVEDGGEERLVLTDYKSGASTPQGAKAGNGKLRLDVQLPLYVEAAAPTLYAGKPVKEARYLSISAAKVTLRVEPAGIEGEALDGLVRRFREALATGSFPVDPDEDLVACRYCDFDAVCRRGPRLSRKRAAANGSAPEEVAL